MRGEEGIWEGRAGQGCEEQWARDGRFDIRKGRGTGKRVVVGTLGRAWWNES